MAGVGPFRKPTGASRAGVAVSIAGLVAVVVSYVLSSAPRPGDVEQSLVDRQETVSLTRGDGELTFVDIETLEPDSRIWRWSTFLARRPCVSVRTVVRVQDARITPDFDLDRVWFASLCTEAGVDADYEVKSVQSGADTAVVEVTVESSRPEKVRSFLDGFERVRFE